VRKVLRVRHGTLLGGGERGSGKYFLEKKLVSQKNTESMKDREPKEGESLVNLPGLKGEGSQEGRKKAGSDLDSYSTGKWP